MTSTKKLVTPSPGTIHTATTSVRKEGTAGKTGSRSSTTTAGTIPSVSYKKSEAALKAEARAYALSSSSSSSSSTSGSKRKAASHSNGASKGRHSTGMLSGGARSKASLPLHSSSRPEKQRKLNSAPRKLNNPAPSSSSPPKTPSTAVTAVTLSEGDEYTRFVQSLGLDDSLFLVGMEDDEDFHLSDADDEEEDDDDHEEMVRTSTIVADMHHQQHSPAAESSSTPPLSSPLSASPLKLPEWEPEFYKDLEEELGSLLEEDYESAVTTLLTSRQPSSSSPASTASVAGQKHQSVTPGSKASPGSSLPSVTAATTSNKLKQQQTQSQQKLKQQQQQVSPNTPLREASRHSARTPVTQKQSQQLQRLLVQHYQLLIQQAVLAIRAAHAQKAQKDGNKSADFFLSGETADDLAELLDGAVGMLQDLDQNRKDAIRNSIQLETATTRNGKHAPSVSGNESPRAGGRRSLLPQFTESEQEQQKLFPVTGRRLTRAAFTKTLQQRQQQGSSSRRTSFDIPGLDKLNETFAIIDQSVDYKSAGNSIKHNNRKNILQVPSHTDACQMVLRHAGASIDDKAIPCSLDVSHHFCDPTEYLGPGFSPPCNRDQEIFIRRNRNLFTSGEDNLVLRGVNLYGEKQWILIADRYLPDRSVNIISQRYSKLCVMLYKANGIAIDAKGSLQEPPKLESVDDIDEAKVAQLGLQRVRPPAILNVHRWSLEEDLTLLKAVPLMGHMWAELGARLIPHRDRGHLRKRYQVLERRVKATITRSAKGELQQLQHKQSQQTHSTTVATSKAVDSKVQSRSGNKDKNLKQKAPPMSVERAAASLALLRPSSSPPKGSSATSATRVNNATTKKSTTATAARRPAAPPPSKRQAPTQVAPKATAAKKRKAATTTKGKAPASTTRKRKATTAARATRGKASSKPALPVASKRKLPVPPPVKPPTSTIGAEASLNADQSCSRTAFEKLVDGTSEDWSQMSRMKKMMENDTESLVADAIVSHLAKAPGPSEVSRLPQMQIDSISLSGLSVLQSTESLGIPTRPGAESSQKNPSSSCGISIMASVLERTSKNDKGRGVASTSAPSPMKFSVEEPSTQAPSKRDGKVEESGMESPQKRKPSTAVPSTPIPPSTPRQSTIYSMSGTPIGLSPGFRPSPCILPSTGGSGGIALTPNPHHHHHPVQQPPSASSSSIVRNLYSSVGDTGGDCDGFEFCNFEISDKSRQEIEGTIGKDTPSKQQDQLRPRSGVSMSLFSSFGAAAGDINQSNNHCTSLMCANDLEAISALNSLSNSPARSFLRRTDDMQENGTTTKTTKRSLFAAVVGGRNGHDVKKDLKKDSEKNQ